MFRQSETQVAQKSPRIPRWGRRGLALLAAVGVLSSLFCLPISAADSVKHYSFGYSRPQVTNYSGFCEVDTGSSGILFVFFCPDFPQEVDVSEIVTFEYDVTLSRYEFRVNYSSLSSLVGLKETRIWGYYVNGYGKFFSMVNNGSRDYCYLASGTIPKPVGVHTYGCVNKSSMASNFAFSYGNESIVNEKLDLILSALQQSGSTTETAVDNANKKAEEREKQETQTGGDNATNDTSNAMPSVDEGFSNSLKSFVGSMSYDGTEALLPIPKTSIPAMAGVTDEITLIAAQDYDLSAAINQYIPETLLQLIRHLLTIALVLYCVYELYGLIQYVLTLKKGGKDE